jgi:hypothetical protein
MAEPFGGRFPLVWISNPFRMQLHAAYPSGCASQITLWSPPTHCAVHAHDVAPAPQIGAEQLTGVVCRHITKAAYSPSHVLSVVWQAVAL